MVVRLRFTKMMYISRGGGKDVSGYNLVYEVVHLMFSFMVSHTFHHITRKMR